MFWPKCSHDFQTSKSQELPAIVEWTQNGKNPRFIRCVELPLNVCKTDKSLSTQGKYDLEK